MESKKFVIKSLTQSIHSQLNSNTWDSFSSKTTDWDRVELLYQNDKIISQIKEKIDKEFYNCSDNNSTASNLENIKDLHLESESDLRNAIFSGWDVSKDKNRSIVLKGYGNQAFGIGSNERACDLYTYSILFMPPAEKNDLSILYGNRSASLIHLNEPQLCLRDIETAFKLGYPQELHYKLFERSGRCLVQLGKNQEATRSYHQALKALNFPTVKLDESKKEKLRDSINKLLKISSGAGFGFICKSSDVEKGESPVPSFDPGSYLRNASKKVSLLKNETEGRFVIANDNIEPGEVVLVEKAFVSVLTSEAYNHQCFQCFSILIAPVPCSNCAFVSFCSEKCRDNAFATHHKYECSILGILNSIGVSITCSMALRVITQAPIAELKKWKETIKNDAESKDDENKNIEVTKLENNKNWREMQFKFKDAYKPDHISSVVKLVSHSKERTPDDFFHRAILAIFFTSLIEKTHYFKPKNESLQTEVEKKEERVIVGTIILKVLQILQFNAHEIAGWDSKVLKSTFLGGGLFPTLAFFNHSCNPAIVRYFINDKVVVRTVRTIQRGEPLTENYGPIFLQETREERQNYLKSRYWFNCTCIPCSDNWAQFHELNSGILSFRCSYCRSFLCKNDTESFGILLRCARCLKPTNMLQSLKLLEKSDEKIKQGLDFIQNKQFGRGEGLLVEVIKLFDKILLPPFQDYHNCQEGLRKCYLPQGNQSNSAKISLVGDGKNIVLD